MTRRASARDRAEVLGGKGTASDRAEVKAGTHIPAPKALAARIRDRRRGYSTVTPRRRKR